MSKLSEAEKIADLKSKLNRVQLTESVEAVIALKICLVISTGLYVLQAWMNTHDYNELENARIDFENIKKMFIKSLEYCMDRDKNFLSHVKNTLIEYQKVLNEYKEIVDNDIVDKPKTDDYGNKSPAYQLNQNLRNMDINISILTEDDWYNLQIEIRLIIQQLNRLDADLEKELKNKEGVRFPERIRKWMGKKTNI
jgi:hypothetical protein